MVTCATTPSGKQMTGPMLQRLGTLGLPRTGEIRLYGVVLGSAVALSIGTGVLFGLAPSLSGSKPDREHAKGKR